MNIDQVMQDLLRQMQNQKGGNTGNFRVQMNMKDMEDLFKKGGPFGGQGFPGGFPDPFGGAFNQRAQQSSNTSNKHNEGNFSKIFDIRFTLSIRGPDPPPVPVLHLAGGRPHAICQKRYIVNAGRKP